LKTFLLFYVLGGCGIAWIAHTYSVYLAEQETINVLTTKISQGTVMTVATNDKLTYRTGSWLL
jgi:hypothetical protein